MCCRDDGFVLNDDGFVLNDDGFVQAHSKRRFRRVQAAFEAISQSDQSSTTTDLCSRQRALRRRICAAGMTISAYTPLLLPARVESHGGSGICDPTPTHVFILFDSFAIYLYISIDRYLSSRKGLRNRKPIRCLPSSAERRNLLARDSFTDPPEHTAEMSPTLNRAIDFSSGNQHIPRVGGRAGNSSHQSASNYLLCHCEERSDVAI